MLLNEDKMNENKALKWPTQWDEVTGRYRNCFCIGPENCEDLNCPLVKKMLEERKLKNESQNNS